MAIAFVSWQSRADNRAVAELDIWPELRVLHEVAANRADGMVFYVRNEGAVDAVHVTVQMASLHYRRKEDWFVTTYGQAQRYQFDRVGVSNTVSFAVDGDWLYRVSRLDSSDEDTAMELRLPYRHPVSLRKQSTVVLYFVDPHDGAWVGEWHPDVDTEFRRRVLEWVHGNHLDMKYPVLNTPG